jgi:hypothetical protein
MAWSNVDEDAERMRETLVNSDHFDKEDSGIATNESAGVSEFIIVTLDGSRYNVTVRDCGD